MEINFHLHETELVFVWAGGSLISLFIFVPRRHRAAVVLVLVVVVYVVSQAKSYFFGTNIIKVLLVDWAGELRLLSSNYSNLI